MYRGMLEIAEKELYGFSANKLGLSFELAHAPRSCVIPGGKKRGKERKKGVK